MSEDYLVNEIAKLTAELNAERKAKETLSRALQKLLDSMDEKGGA